VIQGTEIGYSAAFEYWLLFESGMNTELQNEIKPL